jgi:hypothetical protein
MAALTRAGHWKHEWIPLDYTAAKQKGHGHVPKGWQPGGKKVTPPEPKHGGGWRPSSDQHHVDIEAAGTVGTSTGSFHRTKDAARMHKDASGTWHMHSALSGEKIGEVRPSIDKPGWWSGHDIYDPTGETKRVYHGNDFMAAASSVLGHPGYGYGWYRVKRGYATGPDIRKAARRGESVDGHEQFVARTAEMCRRAGIILEVSR